MRMTRRSVLRSVFFGRSDRTLVVVFLRGGADGLNMVVPYFEKEYYSLRPSLAIAPPDASGSDKCLKLDDRFGFHPSFAPLIDLYRDGRMAIVHAVGSDDDTRSHFEAQDLMERAGRYEEGASGGWLARHLRTRSGEVPGSLSAVAIGTAIPESLTSAPAAAITSLDELKLASRASNPAALHAAIRSLYASGDDPVRRAGRGTMEVLDRIRDLKLSGEGEYPSTEFGAALRQMAALIRAGVGMEVGTVDLGGWDTHFTQGTTSGLLAGRIQELSDGLAAFCADLGPRLEQTTIVVQTEFGRRTYENGSFGTDHGRGSVLLALGGGIRGGRILGEWPGLGEKAREGPGDLAVTTDYRLILAEILEHRFGNRRIDQVFPGLKSERYLGLIS